MLVHLRRGASVVAVVLAGLSVMLFGPGQVSPAEAFCGSLCSPSAPGVLAAAPGTAGLAVPVASTASAAAASSSGAVATAGTASGLSGLSWGQLGLNTTGIAAAIGLTGWGAGWWDVAPGGVAGLPAPGQVVPGYLDQPPVIGINGNTHWRSGWWVMGEPTGIAYRQAASTATVHVPVSIGGSCEATFPGPAFLSVLVYFTDGSTLSVGNINTSQTAPVGGSYCSGGSAAGGPISGVLTFTVNLGHRLFDHLRFTNTNNVPVGDRPGSVEWYPEGHTNAPAEVEPGAGTIVQRLECIGVDGATATVTQEIAASLASEGRIEVPALTCPDGMVPSSAGADWLPAAGSQPGTTLIPDTQTPEWVRDMPTEYPECIGGGCTMELYQLQPGPTTYCGPLAISCADWYRTPLPQRETQYECRFGPYVIATDRCSVYRVPGTLLPNTRIQPDGSSAYDPWPPLPGPGTSPGGETGTEPRECWPSGWSAFNPVQWVYMPVKCALQDAFVPKRSPATIGRIRTAMESTTPVVWAGEITGMFDSVPAVGGCRGPLLDIDAFGLKYSAYPFSACEPPMSTAASWTHTIATVLVVVFGTLACIRALGSGIGWKPSAGGDS